MADKMKAAIHGSSKERALSPKSREDFKGKLIILKEGSQGSAPECLQKRPSSGGSKVVRKPSSGSMEVLESGQSSTGSLKKTCEDSNRPTSGRIEKKLPVVKRKDEAKCSCTEATTKSQKSSKIGHNVKKVSVEGVAIKDSNMKPRQCMAGRAAPSPQSFATIRAEAEPSTGDNVEPEASSDSKDDDRDRGDGNRNEGSPTVERNQTGSKAPLELLGTFLNALMKKDYEAAQKYCNDILLIEPSNPTCLEFRKTLKEKLNQEEEDSERDLGEDDDDDDDDDEDDDDDDDDDDSGSDDSDQDDDSDVSSQSGSESDYSANEESDDEDLQNIDVNKLNLLVGGVPVNKRS